MLKKLGLLLLFLSASGLMIGYYYWRQLTRVPEWYAVQETRSASAIAPTDAGNLESQKSEIKQKVESRPETKLNEQEVNHLIVARLAEKPEGQKLLTAVRGINTNLEKDKIQIGAVVNPQDLNEPSLGNAEKIALSKALKEFPGLKNQDIYVGLESQPQLEKGRIQVDENAKIEIGELNFTLKEISERFGISSEELIQKINQNLDVLPDSELQLEDDELILKQLTDN